MGKNQVYSRIDGEVNTSKQIRIKDIARRANVSIGTVDRVLHHRGEVSEETRQKVLSIIDELGYQPNILASTLASNKQYVFATLFPTPLSDEGYWTKPVVGVKSKITELRQYGITHESFTYSQYDPAEFEDNALRMLTLKPDGVVFAPFFFKESLHLIADLKEKNIPFVLLDSNIPGQGQIAYIGQNSFQCGMLSARLLSIVTGPHENLMVIHYAKEMDNQNHLVQREMGFYEWFRQKKDDRTIRTFEINDGDLSACINQLSVLIDLWHPAGIFVTNSKVYLAARTLELSGKDQIHLIGHDLLKENVSYLRKGIVDFLICQRPEEQGYNAVDTLFRNVIQKIAVKECNYSPIDIVTSENLDFYKEFK